MNQQNFEPVVLPALKVLNSLSYQITEQPLPHKSLKKLPRRVREEVAELGKLAELESAQAILPLLKLTKKYSHVPIFYNFLSVAYERSGQLEKAYASVEEVYRKHPDYLFAKTNYAFLCLKYNQLDLIPDMFDRQYDLKLLYPYRNVFHITEVISFTRVMALYHQAIGQTKIARDYYEILRALDADGWLSEEVQTTLYPSLLRRFIKLFQRKQKLLWQPSRLPSPTKVAPRQNLTTFEKLSNLKPEKSF